MKVEQPKETKVGRGYSCFPSTHREIEIQRVKRGFKSGGQVLDEIFKRKTVGRKISH